MPGRLSIYHPPGTLSLKANPFGKDVANLELFRALAQHGGFEQIDVLSAQPVADDQLSAELLQGREAATRLKGASLTDPS